MKDLVELLKSERLKQGLSLQAVSERAHVSVGMLQSLEEERFESIGPPLLIRSFIKSYCSALGIEWKPLLEQYGTEIASFDKQDESLRKYQRWSKLIRPRNRWGMTFSIVLVLGVAVALYGGAWISKNRAGLFGLQGSTEGEFPQQEYPSDLKGAASKPLDRGAGKESSPDGGVVTKPTADSVATKTEKADAPPVLGRATEPSAPVSTEANPAEILQEEKPKTVEPLSRKHRLEVQATRKTWIHVKVDGKKAEHAELRDGEKREWEADKSMQIVVGHGDQVTIKWDGKPVAPTTKPGQVLRLRLPPSESSRKPAGR